MCPGHSTEIGIRFEPLVWTPLFLQAMSRDSVIHSTYIHCANESQSSQNTDHTATSFLRGLLGRQLSGMKIN